MSERRRGESSRHPRRGPEALSGTFRGTPLAVRKCNRALVHGPWTDLGTEWLAEW
jgi:hypothetical protein